MKHRSVIAFVIVAAALFSLPQLSHDLMTLKGEVGARAHRELLYAFLNMPAGEPTAAAPVVRPAETLLASCTQGRSGATAAKPGRIEASGRAQGRSEGKSDVQSAMLGDPVNDPINHIAGARIEKAVGQAIRSLTEVKVETEVAMIVPPDGRLDQRGLASALASDVARLEAQQFRAEAEGLRVAYAAGTRFDTQSPEWQRVAEEAMRKLNVSAGTLELRVLRDGSKTKVLKFKCNECPATAPRLTRLPRQVAVTVPLPEPVAPVAPFDTIGE